MRALCALTALLVDDHTVLREGLRRSLESAGLSVVADVGDGESALETASRDHPNVVIMDISLPGDDGIEITRQFSSRFPETAVIVLTMFGDEATVRAAFEAGAVAYLVKECSTQEIVAAVANAAHQDGRACGKVAKSYLEATSSAAYRTVPDLLTHREIEVLQMLANGASNQELADKLFISAKTVKNHLAHIYVKLGVESRTGAVAKAVKLGLIRIA